MKKATKTSPSFVPDGWPRVVPRILAHNPQPLVAFIKRVFRATGRYRDAAPTELRIGDSVILVSDAAARRPMTACLYVYVEDADSVFRRAVRAGARAIEEPALMPYGDRRGMIEDAWGNTWQIATRVRVATGVVRDR